MRRLLGPDGTKAPGSLLKNCGQFILRRAEHTDFVAPPSQIAADMLNRRALSLCPPRSQTEQPEFFNRLLEDWRSPRRWRVVRLRSAGRLRSSKKLRIRCELI